MEEMLHSTIDSTGPRCVMRKYIKRQTLAKYGVENSGNGVDLIAIPQDLRICIWNILLQSP